MPIPDDLMEDGENQAVRSFLALYGSSSGISIARMRDHLARSGFEGCWPDWVRPCPANQIDFLTKEAAQQWLRHLFALENTIKGNES